MLIINSFKKQLSGLSMIESLISLVIISIGLLGIAALQLASMQQSSSAHWTSQAVWYSYDMTDRISANKVNAGNFILYDGIDTDNNYNMDCQTNACTAAQMVQADAADWSTMVNTLPGGRGVISSPADDTLQISVMWDDTSGIPNCTNGEPAAANQTCYTVTITQ
jgi:type IV pilus assembly protein PilV